MNIENIIKRPIITEKSVDLQEDNKYVFEVDRRANKHQIAKAVEELFDVKVEYVHTINFAGKTYRRGRKMRPVKKSNWKKAIVTVVEGDRIDFAST